VLIHLKSPGRVAPRTGRFWMVGGAGPDGNHFCTKREDARRRRFQVHSQDSLGWPRFLRGGLVGLPWCYRVLRDTPDQREIGIPGSPLGGKRQGDIAIPLAAPTTISGAHQHPPISQYADSLPF